MILAYPDSYLTEIPQPVQDPARKWNINHGLIKQQLLVINL